MVVHPTIIHTYVCTYIITRFEYISRMSGTNAETNGVFLKFFFFSVLVFEYEMLYVYEENQLWQETKDPLTVIIIKMIDFLSQNIMPQH